MVDQVMFSSKRGDWLTPDEIIEATLEAMGGIDLDPCSDGGNIPARRHYTKQDDGLRQPWFGSVYMNPPYGRGIGAWAKKLDQEYASGRMTSAIALVPARTDTAWWCALTRQARAVCFIRGRLRFKGAPTGAPFPSAVVAFGISAWVLVGAFGHLGDVWCPELPGGAPSVRR